MKEKHRPFVLLFILMCESVFCVFSGDQRCAFYKGFGGVAGHVSHYIIYLKYLGFFKKIKPNDYTIMILNFQGVTVNNLRLQTLKRDFESLHINESKSIF
jgi:hypothetical protein